VNKAVKTDMQRIVFVMTPPLSAVSDKKGESRRRIEPTQARAFRTPDFEPERVSQTVVLWRTLRWEPKKRRSIVCYRI
jgi:hypothetical protein